MGMGRDGQGGEDHGTGPGSCGTTSHAGNTGGARDGLGVGPHAALPGPGSSNGVTPASASYAGHACRPNACTSARMRLPPPLGQREPSVAGLPQAHLAQRLAQRLAARAAGHSGGHTVG